MERSSVLRWILIAAAAFLFWKFGMPLVTGSNDKPQSVPAETYVNAPGFVPDPIDPPLEPGKPNKPTEPAVCKIHGNRFEAELSSRGASLTHLYLTDPKYSEGDKRFDLSTTPDIARWRSLRTLFRGPDADSQVKYDRFNWKLEPAESGKACVFSYEDDTARIVKSITAGERPFELNVETTITNLADAPKRHELSVGVYSFRRNEEMAGSLGRVSPFQTELECASGDDIVRKSKDDFKAGWITVPGIDRYAAVNSYYFTEALIPEPGKPEQGGVAAPPRCEILAEHWVSAGQKADDDDAAVVFHAELVYPNKELAPQASATYRQTAFFGPKDRNVLAKAAGGGPQLGDVINLGFFTPVARVLVGILVYFHNHITFGNWGLAIVAMTVCLRILLFPLSLKQIKNSVAMRRLKPEVDAVNAKFKDDAQAKNLAMMELWKKHGVNPLGGCLPQIVQMPIWWAMYTTLQTAVEMYHTKFLWMTDLSAPDKYYILPVALGLLMIGQQRIMPQQMTDAMQQKMMMYLMPIGFTVMMLFLPAALGVYMLTSSMLGIAQQLIVERVAPSMGRGDVVVVQTGDKDDKGPKKGSSRGERFGKGKASV